MSSNGTPHDPDDFFSETRMTFGDHLEDLRLHLWRAFAGFGLAMIFSLCIGKYAVDFIKAPVEEQLRAYHKRQGERIEKKLKDKNTAFLQDANKPGRWTKFYFHTGQLRAVLQGKSREEIEAFPRPIWGDEQPEDDEPDGQRVTKEDVTGMYIASAEPLLEALYKQEQTRIANDLDSLTALSIMEVVMVWFKVCLVCGFVFGSPWIFWQVWMFVAAGLYPHEKRLVHFYLPISLGLFLTGVLMCEFLVIPRAIEALLWFNEWMGIRPDLRLNEWLSFAIWMPLIFGFSFQTPLVMMFVARLGLVNADTFRNKRRIAWMVLGVFSAIITPTPDAVNMLFLWVPMCLLFEVGIWLIKISAREPQLGEDVPDSEELIEV